MKLTDDELLKELKERFLTKDKALADYQKMLDELGRVNQKLQDSERLKSHFLSNIRNEINNPFASIMGLSRQMSGLGDPPNVDNIRSVASLIYAEAFDLNFQLKNIFAAADSEAGEMSVCCSRVRIADFMQEVMDEFTPLAEQYNIRMEVFTEHQEDQQVFLADAAKLQLILGNLISNAIKFSREDPNARDEKVIRMTYKCDEGQLKVSVIDEGIGINPADHQRIFDSFTQLNDGMTKTYRGHGLGLSVVKALIDLLEGSIELKSQSMQGSTFVITIPELVEQTSEYTSSAGNEFLFDDGEIF